LSDVGDGDGAGRGVVVPLADALDVVELPVVEVVVARVERLATSGEVGSELVVPWPDAPSAVEVAAVTSGVTVAERSAVGSDVEPAVVAVEVPVGHSLPVPEDSCCLRSCSPESDVTEATGRPPVGELGPLPPTLG
jgi:hypothetical protein